MQFSSNQSAVRTGDCYLTNLLQPGKSHVIICTQPTGEIHWCASICCHTSSSQFCHQSHPLRKGRSANSVFGKSKWEETCPFTTSHNDRLRHTVPRSFSCSTELQHDASFVVLRPCNGVPPSGPQSPSKSLAEDEWTQTSDRRTNSFSTHCCAPHPHRGATESPCLWLRAAASVTSFAMARLPRACHTP